MDSRFPTYYLNDRRILRLSATAFRLYVVATAWSVSNMTDGRIELEDHALIPFWNDDDMSQLVKAGLWKVDKDGHKIADFLATQTSAAQLEASLMNRRLADAERQKKKYWRDKAKLEEATKDLPDKPNQVSRESHVRFEGKAEEEAEAEDQAEDQVQPINQTIQSVPDQETFDAQTGELFDPNHCKGCGAKLTAYMKRQGGSCFDCLPLGRGNA